MNDKPYNKLDEKIGALTQLVTQQIQINAGQFHNITVAITNLQSDVVEIKTELARKADTDVMLEHFDGIRSFLEDEKLDAQVDRHRDWIETSAPKIGVPYPVDRTSFAG